MGKEVLILPWKVKEYKKKIYLNNLIRGIKKKNQKPQKKKQMY